MDRRAKLALAGAAAMIVAASAFHVARRWLAKSRRCQAQTRCSGESEDSGLVTMKNAGPTSMLSLVSSLSLNSSTQVNLKQTDLNHVETTNDFIKCR